MRIVGRFLTVLVVTWLVYAAPRAQPALQGAPQAAQSEQAAAPKAPETAADYQGPAAEQFLKKARITRIQSIAMGVTAPRKATLEMDGKTHFGAFKLIDIERPGITQLSNGIDVDFQDSWRTEIAAYEIDRMIGLGMVPATVERTHRGETGSLQWWVESEMPEAERRKRNLLPPDTDAWNRENLKMRLFDGLIYNADRHLNNILVTKNFELRLIDHSRAFRLIDGFKDAAGLTGFSRDLLAGIATLTRDDLRKRVGKYLNAAQISTVLKRRDALLAMAKTLVAEKGESVLY